MASFISLLEKIIISPPNLQLQIKQHYEAQIFAESPKNTNADRTNIQLFTF